MVRVFCRAGEFMMFDVEWVQFYLRVVTPGHALLSASKAAAMENMSPEIDKFLTWVLVRDPKQRPTVFDVKRRVGVMLTTLA